MAIKNRADFVVPPLVPQTVDRRVIDPSWRRYDFLAFLVREFGWTFGAELGLWEGATVSHLLRACPSLMMVGVDLWEPQPDNPGPEGYEGWDHSQHESRCRRSCAPFGDRAWIIKGYTAEAAARVTDRSLDFVFIDADHSEKGCRADIEAWMPKIKADGWILGHDINWSGVRAAVDDLLPGYETGPDVVWFRPVNPGADWPLWK